MFTSDNGVLVLFCFLKSMFILGHQMFNRHSMLLSVTKMPHLQKLSHTNAKTNCLNPKADHYFTAKTGNFLSQEEVGGIDRSKIP